MFPVSPRTTRNPAVDVCVHGPVVLHASSVQKLGELVEMLLPALPVKDKKKSLCRDEIHNFDASVAAEHI